jgi:hypothetical protein
MHFRRFVLLLVVVPLWTGAALAQQTSTSSIISRIVNLPVVNLASSETAQVNLVNLAASFISSSGPVTVSSTASCTGTVTFYGTTGTAIAPATSFTVGTGQISSASLPYADISQNNVVSANGGRTPIRAVVTINASAVTLTQTVGSGAPCTLASSLETYDTSTGVTNVHIDSGLVTFSFGVATR